MFDAALKCQVDSKQLHMVDVKVVVATPLSGYLKRLSVVLAKFC
jgi:hypothetical protein